MNQLFKLSILVILWSGIQASYAQSFEVSGRVIDAETKDFVPFANISLKEIYKGTASNALGEFSFKVDSLPVNLVISHLSYEPKEITIYDETPVEIALDAGELLMDELVIKGQGSNRYPYDLVTKAYYRIATRNVRNNFGKAFYRQISKNGDEYSELYEMFYDTRFSLNGVEDWAIQEGRYALKLSTADSFIYNKNFTLMVRLLTIVQPNTDDLVVPVSEQVQEQYDLTLVQLQTVNNRTVAQVRFKIKEEVTKPAMEGDLFIDTETYNVLKVQGVIANDDLNFITLKGEKGSWKDYKVQCEIAFKPLEDDKLVIDYVRLGQNFDYYYDGIFTNKVETRSFLSYYEYYTPPGRKKLGGRLLRFNTRDSEVLDNIGYNQRFWDDNIIVKRTPIEAEVTASFEEERAFGSIYLNNRNQIVLEDYQMDKDPFIIRAREQLAKYDLPRKGTKLYVHHDKPHYVGGEKLWYKAYQVNMVTDLRPKNESILHINLLSPEGKLLLHNLVPIIDGLAFGQLQLPTQLESGEYQLIAYTDEMMLLNDALVYKEKITIYDPQDERGTWKRIKSGSMPSLSYYPEGGSLIESLPMQMGYVAKDEYGDGIQIRGRLVSQSGRLVNAIKSESDGTGSIFLMPKVDEKYQTMVMTHDINNIEFPKVESSGFALMVNNLKQNTIDVTVRGTMKLEGDKFYLLVISNGIMFDRRVGALTRGVFKTEIPKTNLPNGVTQLLLVDEKGFIKCRRLVFLNQPEEVVVKHYLAKKDFRARERIDMVLELNDQNGKSISGANISVSVLDKDKVVRPYDRNIRSYFNLDYVADHDLHNQSLLFRDHERETLKKLDWLMLIQKSVYPQIASFDNLYTLPKSSLPTATRFALSGKALSKSGGPLQNGMLAFLTYPDNSSEPIYVKTNEEGHFTIEEGFLPDSTEILVMATDAEGKIITANVHFESDQGYVPAEMPVVAMDAIPSSGESYMDVVREAGGYASPTILSKVEINGSSMKAGIRPETSLVVDDRVERSSTALEVLEDRLSGVTVSDRNNQKTVRIRGIQESPIILIDGIRVEEYLTILNQGNQEIQDAISSDAIADYLDRLRTEDLLRFEMIKPGPDLIAKFGEDASNGVIQIFTKEGKNELLETRRDLFTKVLMPGLTEAEPFQMPNYSGSNRTQEGVDLRSTIYWNPDVEVNRRGRAKIGFYNSDEARTLQICVEGITDEGVPIFSIFEIGRNAGRGKVN